MMMMMVLLVFARCGDAQTTRKVMWQEILVSGLITSSSPSSPPLPSSILSPSPPSLPSRKMQNAITRSIGRDSKPNSIQAPFPLNDAAGDHHNYHDLWWKRWSDGNPIKHDLLAKTKSLTAPNTLFKLTLWPFQIITFSRKESLCTVQVFRVLCVMKCNLRVGPTTAIKFLSIVARGVLVWILKRL